jgi:hypothetical protein
MVGCATTASKDGQAIQESDGSSLESCKFLGTFNGSSGWGNLAQSTGMKNAQNDVRDQAAEAGATHLVWTNINGGYAPNVSGKAYRCSTGK